MPMSNIKIYIKDLEDFKKHKSDLDGYVFHRESELPEHRGKILICVDWSYPMDSEHIKDMLNKLKD